MRGIRSPTLPVTVTTLILPAERCHDVRMGDLLIAPEPNFSFFFRPDDDFFPFLLPWLLGFGSVCFGKKNEAQRQH